MPDSPQISEPTAATWQPPNELNVPGYTFERCLSRAEKSAVYEVLRESDSRRFAIKLLAPAPDEMAARRFRERANALVKLTHANLVTTHDSGEAKSRFLVLDFVEGESLAEKIEDGRIPLADAVRIIADAAAGLAALHGAGLVHGDIKPSAILVAKDGKAKLAGIGDPLPCGTTPEYVAPELAFEPAPDTRSDIHALGIVAHELLTGKSPGLSPKAPSVADTALDPAFDGVILTAIESSPARRFANAGDFRTALLKAANAAASRASRETHTSRHLLGGRLVALALGIVAAGAAGVAYFAWKKSEDAILARDEAMRSAAVTVGAVDDIRRGTERARAKRAEVERLAAFLTGELHTRLEEAGRLDALEPALEKSRAYFEKLTDPDDTTPAHKLAWLHARAQSHAAARKWDAAIATARERITLTDELAARLPGDRERVLDAVEARCFLADYLEKSGKPADALPVAQDARDRIATLRATLEKKPGSEGIFTRASRQLAVIHLALGHADEAAAPLDEALAIWKPIADASPADARIQSELSLILAQHAVLATARGDDRAALIHLAASLHCDRLTLTIVWDAAHRLRLTANLAAAAAAHLRLKEPEKAEPYVDEALPLLAQIEMRIPAASLPLQRDLYSAAAEFARGKGDLESAIDHERRANEARKFLEEINGAPKEDEK